MQNRIGYLSGAPRVSTRPTTELVGPRSHILGTIKGFEEAGWKVSRYIVGDLLPSRASSQGSENFLARSGMNRLAADIARMWLDRRSAKRAMRTLGEVDAVYERFALFQGLGRYFQQAGIPWILETNALLTKEAATDRNAVALKRIARDREQRAYERCDVLVAVSDVLKRDIVSEFQIDANKIVVVPNGVDLSVFDPESCEPVRYSDSFTIGFVGALALWQRLDVLLRSVAKVRARGADVAVTIVGDGPKRDAWQALAKELSLEHAAVFVGRVDPSEVPAYIAGFDLAYAGHSGTSESVYFSPIKIYEYMAMGKPVVATRFDDAELLVEEGATGYRFESGDEEELANILEKAQHLGTEELLALGRRARAEVAKSHTWAHRVRELMDELRRREVIG